MDWLKGVIAHETGSVIDGQVGEGASAGDEGYSEVMREGQLRSHMTLMPVSRE